METVLTIWLLFAGTLLEELVAFDVLTVGVFVEFLIAAVLLTVLVMGRIGAGQPRAAAFVGGLAGTLFLAAHFIVGPIVADLTRRGIMQVVLFAGAGTALGLSIAVTMFRPSQHGPTGRGIGRQNTSDTDEADIEV